MSSVLRAGAAVRRRLLDALYAPEVADRVAGELERMLTAGAAPRRRERLWDERDAWLITYPDQFRRAGEAPLATLRTVMEEDLEPWLGGLHVTPFFPWTSDDGFAVTDYLAVDERYGAWTDVEALGRGRRLVADAVVNHLSAGSGWFRGFLAGDPEYRDFFRTADPGADLSATVRPRARPLLTRFDGADGPLWGWTTFSSDQVDLDYRTPEVLLRVFEVLLTYVRRGASVLRLDAVAFLWKQEGTPSIHLPQTHAIVALIRSCLEAVDPSVLVLTETNVPHAENISYFGTRDAPEAHLVYQFPLPPVTLHTLLTGDATGLAQWVASLEPPREDTTFLNFLGSHDGIGVRPAEGLLDADDIDRLAGATAGGRGEVMRRGLPDGATAVYELNSTWYALMAAGQTPEAALRRHLAAHAIMLALRGIPALYVHSLVASDNDREGFERTGEPRALNRRRFDDVDAFRRELASPSTRAGAAWRGLRQMLEWRASTPAFDPESDQAVLATPDQVFAVERTAAAGPRARVYVNVSGAPAAVDAPPGGGWCAAGTAEPVSAGARITLAPWSSLWLTADDGRAA